jgi:hypothetical protein
MDANEMCDCDLDLHRQVCLARREQGVCPQLAVIADLEQQIMWLKGTDTLRKEHTRKPEIIDGISITPLHGYVLSPNKDKVANIIKAIKNARGNCPCVPQNTWNDSTTMCPCRNYREGNGCHCGLYVKESEFSD